MLKYVLSRLIDVSLNLICLLLALIKCVIFGGIVVGISFYYFLKWIIKGLRRIIDTISDKKKKIFFACMKKKLK